MSVVSNELVSIVMAEPSPESFQ